MGRIVAIDFGKKRTGLAVTDPLQIIPGPLITLPAKDVIVFLKEYTRNEKVDTIVVGKAMQTYKEVESDSMRYIRPFVAELKKSFPSIEVILHDERYTSQIAMNTIRESGAKKKQRQDKALVDRVSAVVILQSYLYARDMKSSQQN